MDSDHRAPALLGALSQLARTITEESDPIAILESLAAIAGEALAVDRSLIYRVTLAEEKVVGLCEWLNPRVAPLSATLATYPLAPFAPVAAYFLSNKLPFESHASAPDVRLVETGAHVMLHGDMGIKSLLWFPFRFEPDGFMLLVFNRVAEACSWSALEVAFIDAVAHLVTLALHKTVISGERARAQEALRAQEARYRSLYDNTPTMFFTLDQAGRIRSSNRFAAELLGWPIEELNGAVLADVVHPDDLASVERALASTYASPGELSVHEFRKRRRDGSILWVKETMRTQTSAEGEVEALVVCEDVTEGKRAAEALLRSQNLESLGLLSAHIAHDFNNLLVGVLTNADVCRVRLDAGLPVGANLDQLVRAGRLAKDLVRRVLAFSGNATIERSGVDVDDVVRDVVELVAPSISNDVTVSVDLKSEGSSVLSDPAHMNQLVMNLVVNALEASAPTEGQVTIRTRVVPRTEVGSSLMPPAHTPLVLVFEVADTGVGMSAETLARIFDPLFSTKTGGRGLGLAAVAGLVKAHGARITVESERGVGTVFRVALPVTEVARSSSTTVPQPQAKRAPLTVVVVDDNALVRSIVGSALAELGHRAILASTASEAVENARGSRPSCALIDLVMPADGCVGAIRGLREQYPDLPIIIMSGYAEADAGTRLGSFDVAQFLGKPFTMAELENKLDVIQR